MEKLTINKVSEIFQRPDWVGKTSTVIVAPFLWCALMVVGVIGLLTHPFCRLCKKDKNKA